MYKPKNPNSGHRPSANSANEQSSRQRSTTGKPKSSSSNTGGSTNKHRRPQGKQGNKKPVISSSKPRPRTTEQARSVSRGEAIRAQRRNQDDANRTIEQYKTLDNNTKKANFIDDSPKLKIIGLGGMDGGGSKNMMLIEYANDAIVIDCGNDLSVDLPGINYGICDASYLERIKHKVKGYVITHGHLDHIGGLPHIVHKVPAPIYGGRFTIGRVEEIFNNFGLPQPDGFKTRNCDYERAYSRKA